MRALSTGLRAELVGAGRSFARSLMRRQSQGAKHETVPV